MKRLSLSLVVCVASILTGASARASCGVGACPGDCNGVAGVQIDEIITCVGIGLELLPADTCGSCDANFDGEVTIDELVFEVNTGLGIGGCVVDCFCGDGVVETGESCDDGNPFGGDGCVLNCTEESVRQGTLDAKRSTSVWQTAVIPILLNLSGSVDLRTGEADGAGFVENGPYPDLGPGDIPVTIKTTDVNLDQISVPGLVCACIRGVSAEPFGPGNAGVGVIGCGARRLDRHRFADAAGSQCRQRKGSAERSGLQRHRPTSGRADVETLPRRDRCRVLHPGFRAPGDVQRAADDRVLGWAGAARLGANRHQPVLVAAVGLGNLRGDAHVGRRVQLL